MQKRTVALRCFEVAVSDGTLHLVCCTLCAGKSKVADNGNVVLELGARCGDKTSSGTQPTFATSRRCSFGLFVGALAVLRAQIAPTVAQRSLAVLTSVARVPRVTCPVLLANCYLPVAACPVSCGLCALLRWSLSSAARRVHAALRCASYRADARRLLENLLSVGDSGDYGYPCKHSAPFDKLLNERQLTWAQIGNELNRSAVITDTDKRQYDVLPLWFEGTGSTGERTFAVHRRGVHDTCASMSPVSTVRRGAGGFVAGKWMCDHRDHRTGTSCGCVRAAALVPNGHGGVMQVGVAVAVQLDGVDLAKVVDKQPEFRAYRMRCFDPLTYAEERKAGEADEAGPNYLDRLGAAMLRVLRRSPSAAAAGLKPDGAAGDADRRRYFPRELVPQKQVSAVHRPPVPVCPAACTCARVVGVSLCRRLSPALGLLSLPLLTFATLVRLTLGRRACSRPWYPAFPCTLSVWCALRPRAALWFLIARNAGSPAPSATSGATRRWTTTRRCTQREASSP